MVKKMVGMSPVQRQKYKQLRREGYTHDTALNSVGINTWSFRSPLDSVSTSVRMTRRKSKKTKKRKTNKKTMEHLGKRYKIFGIGLMIASIPFFVVGCSYAMSYFVNMNVLNELNQEMYAGPELDELMLQSAYDLQGYMSGMLTVRTLLTLGIAVLFLIVGYTQYKKGKKSETPITLQNKKKNEKARVEF